MVIDSSAVRAVESIVVARWTYWILPRERFAARRLAMSPSMVGAWKEAVGEVGRGREAVDDAISGRPDSVENVRSLAGPAFHEEMIRLAAPEMPFCLQLIRPCRVMGLHLEA